MDIEEVEKILEGVDRDLDIKNAFVKGLVLLSNYIEDIIPYLEHDQGWFGSWNETSKMSKEEVILMGKYGFFISEESWSHF